MTVLCYHAVQPGWTSPLSMEPEAFADQAAWLARHRSVLPLGEAVEQLDGSGRLGRGRVALTFDDGFRSLYDHALPVLRRHRLPATVFLVAATLTERGQPVDWVDTPPRDQQLLTLTREQVLEMQDAGVAFESHSYRHGDLTRMSYDECVRDLTESRELLEELLGRPVRLLAYPRGRHNELVRAAAERAGYSHAFALPEGRERPGRYAVPRVGIYHGNGVPAMRVKTLRPYLRVRTGPAYGLARRARRVRRAIPG